MRQYDNAAMKNHIMTRQRRQTCRRLNHQKIMKYLFISLLISLTTINLPASPASEVWKSLCAFPDTGKVKSAFQAIDPQKIQDQQDMTWSDYHAIPGKNWADTTLVPKRIMRIALVAVDFDDQPFVITLPKHSDLFGNPQIDPIKREAVPQFYADFFNKPGKINRGHTINEYWMEQSRGNLGIAKFDVFGPYRMPKKLFQYGLNEWGQESAIPSGFKPNGYLEEDADSLWRKAVGRDLSKNYDIILRIYAGYDETSVWQEFGEMKFQDQNSIPIEWGNPDQSKPRWAPTRYVPWTSWKAGQMQWGISSLRQGENSGTITHEICHYAFEIGDNNNNPYKKPFRRAGSGTWDIMDRGSFNGPGGPHRRWVIPATEGASMPAGLMLRSRLNFKFLTEKDILTLSREGLAKSGLVVAEVTARAVAPLPGTFAGIKVLLDCATNDRTPACDPATDPLCAGCSNFNFYSLEVIQRLGYDSYTTDNGVLLAKNKDKEDEACGYGCFTWVIDAHPEDINMLDFKRPDGTPVMRSIADYRQLNDALFHAGTFSGSKSEWVDEANRLHFYILDLKNDKNGILTYKLGIRSLDGKGKSQNDVSVLVDKTLKIKGSGNKIFVNLKNTGKYVETNDVFHPQDVSQLLKNDIYRLSVSVEGKGWEAKLYNEFSALAFGEEQKIPIYIEKQANCAKSATLTIKAQSESDKSKVKIITIKLVDN
jgi:M6 family metalloprotease-like protein